MLQQVTNEQNAPPRSGRRTLKDGNHLSGFPGIENLSAEQQARVEQFVTLRHFGAGDMVLKRGEPANSLFVIKSGAVTFFSHDAHGREIVFRTLGPGQFFGEASLLENATRSAAARVPAGQEAFVWEMPKEHLDEFLHLHPAFAVTMLRQTVERMTSSGLIVRDMARPSIERELDEKRTPLERTVQKGVALIGSVPFLVINLFLCLLWIFLIRGFHLPWDKEEFPYLVLVLAVEALVMTVLVLTKQNRDEKDANVRANTLLEKSHSTEKEIHHLREMIDALMAERQAEKQRDSKDTEAKPQ